MAGAGEMMSNTEREMNTDRHRGRPRNEAHDEAILDATLELVAQVGIAGLTVDAVAHLAGVGKATIYRRWNSKEALLLDAWNTCLTISDVPDTGSLRGDMEALFAAKDLKMPAETMKRIFPQLIAAAKVNPDVGDTYKAFVEQRRLPMRMVLERAIDRGELQRTIDLALVQDLLVAPFFYRSFISDGPTDSTVVAQLLDIVLAGLDALSRTPANT